MSSAGHDPAGHDPAGRDRAGRGPAGATRDESVPRKRRPWWLWLLLGLLALGVLLFALSQCGGPDPSPPAAQTAPPRAAATPTTAPGSAGAPATPGVGTGTQAGAGSGALTAAGTSLLPLAAVSGPGGDLTAQVGQQATSAGATVQSVPADEGFWVGTSETDRIWVQLTGEAGETGYTVQTGDRVDFTGQVVAHDSGFAEQATVDAAEGAELLSAQAAHIEVVKSELRGTTG